MVPERFEDPVMDKDFPVYSAGNRASLRASEQR